jgi:hypothetical protein
VSFAIYDYALEGGKPTEKLAAPVNSMVYTLPSTWTPVSASQAQALRLNTSYPSPPYPPNPPERYYAGTPDGCPQMTLAIGAATTPSVGGGSNGQYDDSETLAANASAIAAGGTSSVSPEALPVVGSSSIPSYVVHYTEDWGGERLFAIPFEGKALLSPQHPATTGLSLDVSPFPTHPNSATSGCHQAFASQVDAILSSAQLTTN